MSTIMDRAVEQEYLELVRAFPLLSIRDDAHLDEAVHVIDRLTDIHQRSTAEDAYLDALTDLVETYENAHVTIPTISGVEALRYLFEENALTDSEIEALLGSPATAADILAGKRPLTLQHIRKLSAHFGLPADVFLAE